MHIQELSLQTCHLADQKDFYCTTLGLPLLAETTASITLQAGATRLHFQEAQQDVLYHVAELIVHYDLDHETEGPFGPTQVLHVSEIGLPVEDVFAQVSLLKEKLDI